jgi:predicted DsbA family dithiol-disulfide isomerase
LPLRIKFSYEYDTAKAVEKGISKDPTLVLEDEIFLEGLAEAEVMTEMFEKLVKKRGNDANEVHTKRETADQE